MGFSRPEHWSGQHFPSLGDLPNPGIERGSPASQADSLLTELSGQPKIGGNVVIPFHRQGNEAAESQEVIYLR